LSKNVSTTSHTLRKQNPIQHTCKNSDKAGVQALPPVFFVICFHLLKPRRHHAEHHKDLHRVPLPLDGLHELHNHQGQKRKVYSPPRDRDGRKNHIKSHLDNTLTTSSIPMGGFGIDGSGNAGAQMGGGLQISIVKVPDKYATIFSCEHGEFVISRKEIYDRFKEHTGARVDVTYQNIYRTRFENEEVKERALVDYDFLDAFLLPPEQQGE